MQDEKLLRRKTVEFANYKIYIDICVHVVHISIYTVDIHNDVDRVTSIDVYKIIGVYMITSARKLDCLRYMEKRACW